MELNRKIHDLLALHERQTQHMPPITRGISRKAYAKGIQDCFASMSAAAVSSEERAAGDASFGSSRITAPLAVQPNHVAGSADEISE